MKYVLFFLMLVLPLFGVEKKEIVLTEPSFTNFQSKNIPLSMELNFWNTETYKGKTFLKYDPSIDTIEFFAELSDIKQKNPSGWVLGYPEVFYGFKPWVSNGLSIDKWKLPEQVKDLQNIVFKFGYEIWYKDNLPINLAMETWITKEKYPSSVKEGEVEIMVWLYYNILGPAGFKIGEVEIPIKINGKEKKMSWEIWYAKMTWDYVAFKPVIPFDKAVVEVPIKPFVSKTREILANYSERVKVNDFDKMYFEVWEVGTEFGNPQTTNATFGYKFFGIDVIKK
ncbi:MAG: hypothetical protein N2258_04045 [Brevinematales bacterium]|nr:hypothetical protein [Brevinematales bacterium]